LYILFKQRINESKLGGVRGREIEGTSGVHKGILLRILEGGYFVLCFEKEWYFVKFPL
jgi:hypothetical protein